MEVTPKLRKRTLQRTGEGVARKVRETRALRNTSGGARGNVQRVSLYCRILEFKPGTERGHT